MKKILVFIIFLSIIFLAACSKSFLNVPPQGAKLTGNLFANKKGVGQLLTGAYHSLTGLTQTSSWYGTAGSNWIYGDCTSGDAYRGGSGGDNPLGINFEEFQAIATNGYMEEKWGADYDGVARANSVITAATSATDMSDAEKQEAVAEARFLRGHFHFDAKKMWNHVPFIDETVVNFKVSNEPDIWPLIEADFRFAFDNLPENQDLVGKANKWAAACYLAKCFIFEKKFPEAKALLDSIISMGKNSKGVKYDLAPCYHDNFDVATENNQESVFQVQCSANDGSSAGDNNLGEINNTAVVYPLSSYYVSWKQPSFNLVNAFKTDMNGLPMMDASGMDTSNLTNMPNDMGIESGDPFTLYAGTVDPRLDWSVGRRGIPYLDWGVNEGKNWVSDQTFGGPYTNIKNSYRSSQVDTAAEIPYNNYFYASSNAVNYSIIRFADVLLWAAEAEVEAGSVDKAREYVNRVRTRAKNGCYVQNGGVNAANYFIDLYNAPWTSQDYARNAIRFERRLELSMEGQRFFDLVRWGIAATYINKYLDAEKTRIAHLSGISFTAGKNEYFPIPQQEIDLSNQNGTPLLKQNPGF
ncbi:MAG TPA: RagB/SusD family nutrient uptake outer membrane protein [Puia sp.]|nr:RagB/SusD family nutrient uptake outer membrane protein [Puia sp.]